MSSKAGKHGASEAISLDGSAWRAARLSWSLMTRAERRRGAMIAVGHAAASLIDTISLVGVLPLITVIIEPESIRSNAWLAWLHRLAGSPSDQAFIIELAIGAVILLGLGIAANLGVKIAVKQFGVVCQERLGRELMNQTVEAPYPWFLRQNATKLARLVYSDVLMWSNDGVQRLIAIVGHVTLLLFTGAVVLASAKFAGLLGVMLIGLAAVAVMAPIRTRVRQLSQFRREADAKSLTVANEIMGGIKDVKISGRGPAFVDLFVRAFNVYGVSMATLKLLQAVPPVVMLFLGQAAIIAIAVVLWQVGSSSGEIAAQMALVLLVTSRVIPATVRLLSEISTMWNVVPHIEGILALKSEAGAPTGVDPQAAVRSDPFADWRRIDFVDVGYNYAAAGAPALTEFSGVLERGKSYGVVGPTGAGKTTFVDLLLGLLPPTDGQVRIDGVALTPASATAWQRRAGYVPQSPLIVDDTLLANVAFGVTPAEVDEARVRRCLELANLSDVLASVTLNGDLGDRGGRLSGGQRQRVAIARALYDDPTLLVLDEATSALDTLAEQAVQGALDNLRGLVTTVTVAHRLATIEKCDLIFLIERGSLVACGVYSELLRVSPLFARMAKGGVVGEGVGAA